MRIKTTHVQPRTAPVTGNAPDTDVRVFAPGVSSDARNGQAP